MISDSAHVSAYTAEQEPALQRTEFRVENAGIAFPCKTIQQHARKSAAGKLMWGYPSLRGGGRHPLRNKIVASADFSTGHRKYSLAKLTVLCRGDPVPGERSRGAAPGVVSSHGAAAEAVRFRGAAEPVSEPIHAAVADEARFAGAIRFADGRSEAAGSSPDASSMNAMRSAAD